MALCGYKIKPSDVQGRSESYMIISGEETSSVTELRIAEK
jgi:hypothetical protein